MPEGLAAAVAALLASNRGAGGLRDYYGVQVNEAGGDGATFDVVLTFKAGERYCCAEAGCHLAYHGAAWWRRLRAALAESGGGAPPLLTIRRLRGVVEPGACLECNPAFGRPAESEGYSYEIGPIAERFG